jgi:hypothetical protein
MKQRIALPLLLCAILAGCGSLTRHGPLDPALTAFIPSDAVALMSIHMDQIRTTPIYLKLAAQNKLTRFDGFSTEMGFDLAKDVHEFLLASDGRNMLAIMHGDFKAKRPAGLESASYDGYTLYIKDPREAIAFLDDRTALGGAAAGVRAAIDRWKAGARSAPPDLMARAQAVSADAQIWAVASGWKGAGPGTLREMGNAANLDRMLRSVAGANLTIDLRQGAHAAATGDCRTEADAQTLSESLRGLAGIARLGVPKNRPELLRAFDGIQVKQQGQLVKVNIDIPADVADRLWK